MKRLLVLLVAVAVAVLFTLPSYAAEGKFSGHYRIRAWSVDGVVQDGASHGLTANGLLTNGQKTTYGDEQWSLTDHRLRLNIDVSEGPVMARLQINAGNYNWGESQNSSAWNREMFLQFPLGSTTVKVGKYWAASPYTLGEIMYMNVLETLAAVVPVSDALTLIGVIIDVTDAPESSVLVYGLVGTYAPKGSMFNGAAGFYYNVANTRSGIITIQDRPMWLAGVINAAQGPWSASITGASKFGNLDVGLDSYDYSAYAFDLRGSYDFGKAGGPPLTLTAIFGYGSGDDNQNPTDRDLKEFTTPSPSYTHTNIFLDWGDAGAGGAQLKHPARAQAGGLGNLTTLILKASYKLTDKTTLDLAAASFYLTEKIGGTAATNYQDNEIGQEVNVSLKQNLAKGLNLLVSGAWFMPNAKGWTLSGTKIGSAGATSESTVSEYYAKIQFDF